MTERDEQQSIPTPKVEESSSSARTTSYACSTRLRRGTFAVGFVCGLFLLGLFATSESRQGNGLRHGGKDITSPSDDANQAENTTCPLQAPTPGTQCALTADLVCSYDFVKFPVPRGDTGECHTESLQCLPTQACACLDSGTWECQEASLDVVLCDGDLPMGAYDECFVEDDTQDETSLVTAGGNEDATPTFEHAPDDPHCPAVMPQNGSQCTSHHTLDSDCPYQFTKLPKYESDGSCSSDVSDCVPLALCSCLGGAWECYVANLRQCAGPWPLGAFEPCQV